MTIGTPLTWIRSTAELGEYVRSLEGTKALALDTESDSFFHYFEKVCLLQLCDDQGRGALLDPIAFQDYTALAPIMADPGVEKILHGADNDIMLLKRDFKFEFASVFDTQVAARFAGRLELGLQAVLHNEFGVNLSKSLQRCDWSRRPLSKPQEDYAVEDVSHLIALRDRLLPDLRERGREAWAREEGEALARLAPAPIREPSDFFKAKGAVELDGRALAVLRELFALRDEWARNADLPLFKIVGDEPLVEIARQRPRDARGLGQIRGLSGLIKNRYASDVLAAIRRGEAIGDDQLPVRTWTSRPKPVAGYSKRVDRLKAWRVEAAKKAALEPGVLLPQRLIERISIDRPTDLVALAAIPDLRRWRAENFGPEILKAVLA